MADGTAGPACGSSADVITHANVLPRTGVFVGESSMELEGKTAIVTGGGGPGCGSAIARRRACEGAAVVVCDVDETAAKRSPR